MKISKRFILLALLPAAVSLSACDEEAQPRGLQTSYDDENDVDEEDYVDGEEAPDIILSETGWEATRNIREADGLPAGCEYIDLYTGWVPHGGWQTSGWVDKGQRTILNARTSCGTINMRVGYIDAHGTQRSLFTRSAGGSGWHQQSVSLHAGESYVNYATVCLVGDSEATKNHANYCWGIYR